MLMMTMVIMVQATYSMISQIWSCGWFAQMVHKLVHLHKLVYMHRLVETNVQDFSSQVACLLSIHLLCAGKD